MAETATPQPTRQRIRFGNEDTESCLQRMLDHFTEGAVAQGQSADVVLLHQVLVEPIDEHLA